MMELITVVGVSTVVFGISALILTSRARKRLSEGSIRNYMDNFAVCLAFIIIFSMWQTTRSIFGVSIDIGGLATYPEYLFIVFAYVAFIIASYRILKISEEFGFKDDGRKIAQIIGENKKIKAEEKQK